jgi:fumarate hydratase subunit alpha/L(+)-tartrate dehydratase alpha subunit
VKAVKKFVLECVFDSGANPCPPTIVGIGLGGTSDLAAALAKEASSFRKVGSRNADPQVAQLEAELLDLINQTGIGPQGLGGVTTAMAVNIEWAHTHISQLPVAVNMQCWRGERACAIIDADGNVSYSN